MIHRVALDGLETALIGIVRSGEHIDAIALDGDEWVVITEDRIETRPSHAVRLGVTER